jgi:pimeloyl-ACP methyl ester carboxylesterase
MRVVRIALFAVIALSIIPFYRSSSASGGKDPIGTWLGKLNIQGFELRIVINITTDSAQGYKATMDSPDQGAKGIKASKVTYLNDTLTVEVAIIKGTFRGVFTDDTTLTGKWKQGSLGIDLVMHRQEKPVVTSRPQEPKPPYPYEVEEVTVNNNEANVTLAGTLTTPKGKGPFPAVVLVTGSGPQDRDESIMGHKPFHVLADYLTRRGIAVLRYDDRGIGKSTGSFASATSLDFTGDALSSVAFLKKRSGIDTRHIGIIGHSEGGMIAPMAAVRSSDVAFVVLMAGPGVKGDSILYMQGRLILKAMGTADSTIETNTEFQRRLFAIVMSGRDSATMTAEGTALLRENMQKMKDEDKANKELVETRIREKVENLLSPWYRYFLAFDPYPTLLEVRCPLLAINGELDLQVPPVENLNAIERAMKESGNKHWKTVMLPKLNHLMQTAKTGSLTEYSQIEETMAPVALQTMGDWILDVVSGK